MAQKVISARFQCKNDTSENWAKATNFIPLKGEMIYYTDLDKFKIGDGTTKLSTLKFREDSYATVEELKKKYEKPSAGIPKSDLASSVQTTLTEAGQEAYLKWGGKNIKSSFSPIDGALVPALGANRFAFLNPAGVTTEYSRDGGTTWVEYTEITDDDIKKLFSLTGQTSNFIIGGSRETGIDKSNHMIRITIDTVKANVYAGLRKFIILVSTNDSQDCYCSVETKLGENFLAGNDVWDMRINRAMIAGWTGWNVLNTELFSTSNGRNEAKKVREIRFTFGVGSHNSSSYPGLTIISLFGFGGVAYSTNSNLAQNGSIYSYDHLQNCKFPAGVEATKVTATTLNGNLNASYLTNCSEYTSAEVSAAWNA